ncbi:MAG: hypothetical protein GY865_12285 [candidate division Zixibacteria bacterium]|nr:hypothetical protein [candidate division Zixibacteria bacterium]
MYKVDKTEYGFRVAIMGDFNEDEMNQFQCEVESFRSELPEIFSGFIDARKVIAFDKDSKKSLKILEESFKKMGCQRYAVILQSPVLSAQVRQIAFESENDEGERQINSLKYENWEQLGLDWVINGIDPDDNINNLCGITSDQIESK